MTKLHFLTSLSSGVHSPRRCPYRALLSDHENKRFVIIVLRDEPQQVDGRVSKAIQHIVSGIWDKNNPFSWGDDSPAHRVVALEVDWSSIVGIDYRCPLHDDGKLVLEARQVVKRCFKTVEDARDFYSPRTVAARSGPLRPSSSAAPTPSKVSLDGRTSGVLLPLSPLASRAISCGPSMLASAGLWPASSADIRGAAASVISGNARTGVDCSAQGRGTASAGLRPNVDAGSLRSISAARATRTNGIVAHVGCAVTRASSSTLPSGTCIDFASADEGEGSSRHLRILGGTSTVRSAASGGQGSAGGRVRRCLQLHTTEPFPGSGQEVAPYAGTVMAALQGVAAQHDKYLGGSHRKARSANDLCGLAGVQEVPGHELDEASVSAVATSVGAPSCEWTAYASDGHGPAPQRREAAHNEALERGRSFGSRGGCGAVSNAAFSCSKSVDSLRTAFLSQQQHLAAAALRSRRRHSVRREYASWTQLTDSCPDGVGRGEARCGSRVPRASRFTQPSATYYYNTLVLGFRDPFLPQELRRFVKSDMRLLKLYESGLPSWAVFMPCYGLPYRPWLRRALWLLFIAISIFSMGCGFYDLYKNVPFLKQVITAVASRMYLPAAELFEWLERHTQIRMSILLTYLFSKSPLLMSLMRMLRSLVALLQQLLRPAALALSATMQPVIAALQVAGATVGGSVAAAATALWQMAQPFFEAVVISGREVFAFAAAVLGPPARTLWAVAVLLAQLVRLVAALVGMVLVGPLQLACSIGGVLSWAGAELAERLALAAEAAVAVLRWTVTLGRAARRVAPAVKAGARMAAQAAGAAAGGGGGTGVSGGMAVWQWLGLEVVGAYNAVRMTFVQAFKSAQAVVNFCVTVAQTAVQHRVSLLLQLRRFITRQKERLPAAVAASVPLPAFVSIQSFTSLSPFDIPLPGSDHDEELDEEPDLVTGLTAVPAEHSLYDLSMGLLGSSEDESHLLAASTPSLYSGDGVMIASRDGGGLGGSMSIHHGGHRGRLQLRRHLGAAASRLGGVGSGVPRYGMYDTSRQPLDAVHEEDLEDAQQLSDRPSLDVEARLGRGKAGEIGAYLPRGRGRVQMMAGGTRDVGRDAWGQAGVLGVAEEALVNGKTIRYASAPSCDIQEDRGHVTYGTQPSMSSPSRRQARGLESNCLTRSVSSPGKALDLRGCIGGEAMVNRRQEPCIYPEHQEQQRCAAGALAHGDLSQQEGTLVVSAPKRDADALDGQSCGSRRRKRGKGVPRRAACTVEAGIVASGLVPDESLHTLGPRGKLAASGADTLTLSSPFARDRHSAQAVADIGAMPSCGNGDVGSAAATSTAGTDAEVAAVGNGKAPFMGNASKKHMGRGGGGRVGANNTSGKPPGVGAEHGSRQQTIQAA
ncbi:hypothetical protein Vafri_3889 [Volvox africanus]|uniref:Uncharacterized protein n=1 Tax=Volvox africanus TaxID=51714 RepID=A0A8J4AT71_9CHLO|nr:hypothetical protein Vafri_3889 [Volvox africanus]